MTQANTFYRKASAGRGSLDALFLRPSAEFRGTPFWAWNGRLDRDQLKRQIDIFSKMGFGGFHIHSRTGLETPYLGREYLDVLKSCVKYAKRRGLLAWLYDEDRWPSGFGGGKVTADPQHRAQYLLFSKTPYSGEVRETPNISFAGAGRLENGILLARYAVTLEKGFLSEYRRLSSVEYPDGGEGIWYAYAETVDGVPWFNYQGYADTLSPAAVRRFAEVSYEPLKREVGEFFGSVVPAIFTDEPQHIFTGCFDTPGGRDITAPITSDFFRSYSEAYQEDLLEYLPEVFFEMSPPSVSVRRYRYHNHVTDRFAKAFSGTLGQWCTSNGVMLTGHMMEEVSLASQTRAVGEVMRSLAHFDLPGVDMLCDDVELTTVKQAQSIARQYNRPGVMSELYGVTGWHFDFVGHKAQGDWQAALGVTVRVPHLAWASMRGEAKRDYPASIGYQSPWWPEYRLIEDHFARVGTLMSRGRPVVHVAVIHPIESFWLRFGPLRQTAEDRADRESQFAELPEWLLGSMVDFDYLSEALLLSQVDPDESPLMRVGASSYRVVVVPGLLTMRSSTLAHLERFAASGGRVIFAGSVPSHVDGLPSKKPARLARKVQTCEWNRRALLALLDDLREVDCTDEAGVRCGSILHQLRADGRERHLFICNTKRDVAVPDLRLKVRGYWRLFHRNTGTGKTTALQMEQHDGCSCLTTDLAAHGHLLLTLRPGRNRRVGVSLKPNTWVDVGEIADPIPIRLSEPNVLLLDQPEWRWEERWNPPEELLRIDNTIRNFCGLAPRDGSSAQPWVEQAEARDLGKINLRFRVQCDVAVPKPRLAIEDARNWQILVNGDAVAPVPSGWWVDEGIQTVPLPPLRRGENLLELSCRYTSATALEWIYLLGDFGVRIAGRHSAISAPVRTLAFGDWTSQGLPFYAGNVIYRCHFISKGGPLAVSFPKFENALLSVDLNEKKSGKVAFAPFRCELGRPRPGKHSLEITAFGNRSNAFGPVHNCDERLKWFGPSAWRSKGDHWSYEYQLRPMGLVVAPRLQTPS